MILVSLERRLRSSPAIKLNDHESVGHEERNTYRMPVNIAEGK